MNDYILNKAIQAGVCADSIPLLQSAQTIPDLLSILTSPQGIEFLMAHDFPSKADLVELAGDALPAYGIYVDANYTSGSALTILLGNSTANIQAVDYQVKQVYAKHQSQANISAHDHSFVVIDCHDQAQLNVTARDQAKVLVNVYGSATVKHSTEGSGMVKIVNKLKETY